MEPTVGAAFKFPKALHDAARLLAQRRGTTFAEYVEHALRAQVQADADGDAAEHELSDSNFERKINEYVELSKTMRPKGRRR